MGQTWTPDLENPSVLAEARLKLEIAERDDAKLAAWAREFGEVALDTIRKQKEDIQNLKHGYDDD